MDELIKRAQAGDLEARDQVVAQYKYWVLNIARRYRHKCRWFELDDLIQAGNIGLLRAIQLYRFDKECKFITYSAYWIRQGIQRMVKTECVIKVASSRYAGVGKELNYEKEASLAFSTAQITDAIKQSSAVKYEIPHRIVEDQEERQIRFDKVMDVVRKMTPDLQDAIDGMLNGETLEETAKRVGRTRERIRQRRQKAFRIIQQELGLT